MNNQKNAQELLEVLMNSKSHNPAWALQDVLDKLRNQLSGKNPVDWKDECNVMYVLGYDDCLKDISAICDELEYL